MNEIPTPQKTIRELIEETRLARQAGKNFIKPAPILYNENHHDQSSATGDSVLYNENHFSGVASDDSKGDSHYIKPDGYTYPLYNENRTQEEAARCAALKAATPLEAATRPATPLADQSADMIGKPVEGHVRANTGKQTDEANDGANREANGAVSPVEKVPASLATEEKILEQSEAQSENQTVPARPPATISRAMPPLAECTRIRAQIFARETNPNSNRYKFRNVKLTIWTTDEKEHLASDSHIVAESIFNLMSAKAMGARVKQNIGKKRITEGDGQNMKALAAHLRKQNERNAIGQEEATLAYLVLKGKKSGVSGSQIVLDQIATLEWKRLDGTSVPIVTLFDGIDHIQIVCDTDVREKNKFNRMAAEYIGYHDPLDYNSYRKKKKKE